MSYAGFCRTAWREELRYFFTDSFLGSLNTLVYIALTLLLYRATGATTFFGVFTWSMIVWYLIVAQFVMRTNGHLVADISKDITSGDVLNLLLKPVEYPLALIAVQFGGAMVQSLALLVVLFPVALILVGPGVLSILGVFGFIITLLGSILLNCAISLCLGLIAFWTEDAKPYDWIYNKVLMVLGGLIFPLDIFPSALQMVAKHLPPAFLIYYPARLFVDFSWEMLLSTMMWQAIYILVFGAIAALIYKRAVKRVNINGG